MRILAVIPARGGSKGIPRKNLRLLHGRPLLYYALKHAKDSQYITDIVVTTDDDEIAMLAKTYHVSVIRRSPALAKDDTTLDPVVYHAVAYAEREFRLSYDVIVTLQPTAPLLKTETLDAGIKYFFSGSWDTVISVVNRPRLSWEQREGKLLPIYHARKNRQDLPPQYLETGAFLITRRAFLTENSRIGNRVSVYETNDDEGLELREKKDWILADAVLNRKKILFRCDGYIKLGMGHVYNCITMAYSLMMEHDVLLVLSDKSEVGIQKVQDSKLPYRVIHQPSDIEEILKEFQPDIWVHDCLNTEVSEIQYLKRYVSRVVTIEDIGPGASCADASINALYIEKDAGRHIYSGYQYVCLREEFQTEEPKPFSPDVRTIIVMFGGTDPSNLNQKIYQSILRFSKKYQGIRFDFITGIGYDNEKKGVVTCEEKNIYVHPNVSRVSYFMKHADLAITSQGRTIFELAAMGVPAIVLSQNEREQTHRFAQMENGFINLGIGREVDKTMIENTLDWLIHTPSVRENMHELLLRYPLREGVERVKSIILGEGMENV